MVIHGLSTVNCGEIRQFNKKDIFDSNWRITNNSDWHVTLEILRPEKHNPDCEIVCYYFWDKKQNIKVEVTLCRNIKTRKWSSEVYYFKTKQDIQHYRSRVFPGFVDMPSKYYDIIKWIHPCFLEVFGV